MIVDRGFARHSSGLILPDHLCREVAKDRSRPQVDILSLERGGIPKRAALSAAVRGMLASDSITVTDQASGVEHATRVINSKHYPVVMMARHDGHLIGSKDDWFAYYTAVTNANNREVAEIFNADASAIVRVRGIWLMPTYSAVTGAQIGFAVNRISSVGTTGSTVMTPRPTDTTQAALPAGVTCRYGSTAGATVDYAYFLQHTFNEETNAGFAIVTWMNMLPVMGDHVVELVLRQNQGISVRQNIANTVGLTGAMIYFTIE